MTIFNTEQVTEQSDTIYVEIDRRFNIAIVRTDNGIEFRVYPRTEDVLWDAPFTTFEVDEAEIAELEVELLDSPDKGDGQ